MICPSCGAESHSVIRTVRGVHQDRRKCICDSCCTVFDTVAVVDKVYTSEGTVDLDEYRKRTQESASS